MLFLLILLGSALTIGLWRYLGALDAYARAWDADVERQAADATADGSQGRVS